jgi:pimeloyl-ACP methyl ester carboxylesterase
VNGLILLAGAGHSAARIMERQLAAAGLPEELRQASRRIGENLEAGRAVTDVPVPLMALYRPSVQPYLMSWLSLDPATELERVNGPILIIQGTTDLQITPGDARRLHEVRPDARLIIIEGMNHVLKSAPPDRASNIETYRMPDLPIVPALVVAIADFIADASRSRL